MVVEAPIDRLLPMSLYLKRPLMGIISALNDEHIWNLGPNLVVALHNVFSVTVRAGWPPWLTPFVQFLHSCGKPRR